MPDKNGRPTAAPAANPVIGARGLALRALIWVGVVFALVAAGILLTHASVDADESIAAGPFGSERTAALAAVRQWADRVGDLDPDAIARSDLDMVVVDPATLLRRDLRSRDAAFDRLRRKPDGGSRLVLAYLSIGEAQDRRRYWRSDWVDQSVAALPAARAPSARAPDWLGPEIAERHGSFRVRFWQPGWQAVLTGSSSGAVNQLAAAGFDGVYLDRADAYAAMRADRPSAESDMVDLIVRIARDSRVDNPNFMVVMQNAEELVAHQRLRIAIDGVAKQDLLYGAAGDEHDNDPADVRSSVHFLDIARRMGRPVFVVEHLSDVARAADARRKLWELGYVPSLASPSLARVGTD